MGLVDIKSYAFKNFNSESYFNSLCSSSFSPDYSYRSNSYSYNPLFSYKFSSYGPTSYYGVDSTYTAKLDFSPKSSYSSFAPQSSGSTTKFGRLTLGRSTGNLQTDLVNNAMSWVGKVNSDREGNRLFSNGKSHAWCADFVTFNTKKTFGDKLPSSFGSSSVYGLMSWGKQNDCYLDTTSVSNKSQYIAQNVKPGDLMIEKRGGKSHTGIVTKVNSDGSFETVEGNTSNKVATRKYNANSSTLSGFISLDRYAA